MKKLFNLSLYFLLMFSAKAGYTQLGDPPSVTSVFKLNFLMPGVSYEQKMASYQAIYFSVYMDALILSANETSTDQAHVYFTPTFNAEFRNYYNINKRERKGLRTAMNSANYIAPLYIGKYSQLSDFEPRDWLSQMGVVWGIQRNAPKGFSLDLNMGMVYTFNAQNSWYYAPISPIIQLTLGFWMGDKSH